MKTTTMVVIGRMFVALGCAAASGLLAYEGKTGWGWFLFAAVWLGAITATEKTGDRVEQS